MSTPRCDVEVAPSSNFKYSNRTAGDLIFSGSESNTGVYFGSANSLILSATDKTVTFGGCNSLVTLSNGSLGIGNASPAYPLDVSGSANVTGNLTVNGNFTVSGTTTSVNTQTMTVTDNIITLNNGQTGTPLSTLKSGIEVNRGSQSNYYFFFDEASDLFKVGLCNQLQAVATRDDNLSTGYPYYDSAQSKLITRDITTSDIVNLSNLWRYSGSNVVTSSNVGIGLSNPGYALHVNGSIYATNDIIAFSDSNYKKDLEKIATPLDKVMQLNGYTYTRSDLDDQKRYAGLLAQEVQQVLPEVVYSCDGGQKLSVAYGNVVPLLVEAIKELSAKVDDIYKRI